ncbi:MAG: hypothetical protein ABSE46_23415 [Terracidiphilus sp.]
MMPTTVTPAMAASRMAAAAHINGNCMRGFPMADFLLSAAA